MSQVSINLLRTVFLPIGSPPIGSVNAIHADIRKADIHIDNQQLYCLGELDLLIDYLSFSPEYGRQLLNDQPTDYPTGRGKEWQAMLNIPFAINEKSKLAGRGNYEASLGKIKWFMVAPRALEMEIEIIVATDAKIADNADINKTYTKDGEMQMTDFTEEMKDEFEPVMATPEPELPTIESIDDALPEIGNIEPVSYDELEPVIAMDEISNQPEPEIVKIVFNEDTAPSNDAIAAAIHKAKQELPETIPVVSEQEDISAVIEPVSMAVEEEPAAPQIKTTTALHPLRKTRVHGLPKINIGSKVRDE